MSITAEKIGKVFARHKRGLHERDSVTAVEMLERDILSLLQQGEPEGWKPMKFPYTETFAAISDAVEWREHRTLGISVRKFEEAFNKNMALSASPLPPAPGAETGK